MNIKIDKVIAPSAYDNLEESYNNGRLKRPLSVKVVRKFEDVKLPTYATDGSGCFDIYAREIEDDTHLSSIWSTGLKFEIPNGYVMLVYSRSGHGFKYDVRLANCVGVIDSDYRGEVKVKLTCDDDNLTYIPIQSGDAIAQGMIIPYEQVVFEEVQELSSTVRGEGGFGSTNKVNV